MKTDNLSAKELARIDSICLDYEANLRRGQFVSVDELVERYGGRDASVLRAELEAVRAEVSSALSATRGPLAVNESWSTDFSEALPKTGDSIGPYLLGEVLGRGGMGIVFQARDTRLDRSVAIKLLAMKGKHEQSLAERFQREAKAIARLSHPNIVELFDVGVIGGVPYAVMEYLHGDELSDRLNGQSIDAEEVRRIGAQIADALAAAHAGGVIHRDLKPHNIMLVERQGGTHKSGPEYQRNLDHTTIVKLVDFGLSRQPNDVDETERGKGDSETRIGTILGTPGYMAPEQARGEQVTPAADIFSLGCVLYEAFYGRRAFDGPSVAARFAAVLETTPIDDELRRNVDPRLAELIDRCLAKSIDARPNSAAVIAKELRSRTPSKDGDTNDSRWDLSTRRRFIESIAGGFVGSLGGHWLRVDHSAELGTIQRIAVVSLSGKTPPTPTANVNLAAKSPVGERALTAGEELAGMLAQELQRVPNLIVRPYRPISVNSPAEFVSLGKELDVDAVVTGLYSLDQRGAKTFATITLEMISARTGNQIWSETIVAEKSESLLEQTQLVSRLAGAINHRLMPPNTDSDRPETVQALGCLAKGHTYMDPDNSIEGLEMAVLCFEHAISVDGRYPDAHAGLALTLVALATRGHEVEPLAIQNKINQARTSYGFAKDLSPHAFDVRLAGAELNWQTYYRFEIGQAELESLASLRPNDWRVHHQLGLLQLSGGVIDDARASLLLASQLHPQSILVRTDRARLEWFSGNADRAVDEANELLRSFPEHVLATGLLVDIYEQRARYVQAAALWSNANPGNLSSPDAYFAARASSLSHVPYGPFNGLMNQMILQSRSSAIDETRFEQLASSLSPSLPMLVSQHPALSPTKSYDRAKLLLPA